MLLLVLLYEADYPAILLLVLLYEADCSWGAILILKPLLSFAYSWRPRDEGNKRGVAGMAETRWGLGVPSPWW